MSSSSQFLKRKIVIIGGTGKQGSAVITALLNSSSGSAIQLVTLTRDLQSTQAQELKERGVAVLQADLEEVTVDELAKIFAEADSLFSAQAISEKEIEQGHKIIDAAKRAGVEQFVYSSVRQAQEASTVPHFHSKFLIEEYLKKSAFKHYTILRPVSFMENLLRQHDRDKIYFWTDAQTVMQHIACIDIGNFAAQALLHPEKYHHQTIELAADTMNGLDLAETFSRVLGRPIQYEKVKAQDETHRLMVEWLDRNKFLVDVESLKKEYHVKMKSVEEFISENRHMFE